MTSEFITKSRATLILQTVYFNDAEREQAYQLGLDLYDILTRPLDDRLVFGPQVPVLCAVQPELVHLQAADIVIVIPVLGSLSFGFDREEVLARIAEWDQRLGAGHVIPLLIAEVWRNEEGRLPGAPLLTELYGGENARRRTLDEIILGAVRLLADDIGKPSLFVSHAKADLASTEKAAERIADRRQIDSGVVAGRKMDNACRLSRQSEAHR